MSEERARAELWRALGVVAEEPRPHPQLLAALQLAPLDPADHTDLFDCQLVPYAAAYLSADGMLGGEAQDRIAGLWRALGADPPVEPDHLASLLGLYGAVVDAGGAGAGDRARAALTRIRATVLWEHLLPWAPLYAAAAERVAAPSLRPWGRCLGAALRAEARRIPDPGPLALALRTAPPPLAAEPDPQVAVRSVPVTLRSGLWLARRDLGRGARSLGLGLRQGERRYALAALIGQDPPAVLGWLADEAARAAASAAALAGPLAAIGAFWAHRARGTRGRLARLAREARAAEAAAAGASARDPVAAEAGGPRAGRPSSVAGWATRDRIP